MITRILNAIGWTFRASPPGRSAGVRDPIGPRAEREAARYLRRAGYRVLGRNVHVPPGEADLVMESPDRREIVIVEVKCRRVTSATDPCAGITGDQPPPEAAVHTTKQRKLRAVAAYLARANSWEGRPVRIDVVAIDWPERGRPVLRHHPDAVRG